MSPRTALSQLLTGALAAVAHKNDNKAWRELLMLPKYVLCAPGRGGRQHRKAFFLHPRSVALWDSRSTLRDSRSHAPFTEQRQALALSLAREGFDRKACCRPACAPPLRTLLLLCGLCILTSNLHVHHPSMTFLLRPTLRLSWSYGAPMFFARRLSLDQQAFAFCT